MSIKYIDVQGIERVAKYLEPVNGLVPWRKVGGIIHYCLASRYLIDGKVTQVPEDAWEFVDIVAVSVDYENWDLLDHS